MRKVADCCETKWGFLWGPMTVERAVEHEGHRVLTISTPRDMIRIRVTPTGLIRVDGHESADRARHG